MAQIFNMEIVFDLLSRIIIKKTLSQFSICKRVHSWSLSHPMLKEIKPKKSYVQNKISRNRLRESNLMFVASNALVASSCDSNWMNAKFLLILMFNIFPYRSKCLSRSLVRVWIGSKLITNKVFEGFILAEDFLEPPGLLIPRSCCKTEFCWITSIEKSD